MNKCAFLFQIQELNNLRYNYEMADMVLQDFCNITGQSFTFKDCENSIERLLAVKNQFIYTTPEYGSIFFELLKKYHYYMKFEISDAIYHLGHLENPNKNKELIQLLLASPILQDIHFNGTNKFTVFSKQYGEFTFELASSFFKDHQRIMHYMSHRNLSNDCHHHTYFLSKVFPELYSITAHCPCYFSVPYYHSYSQDKEHNFIIDLCGNMIMDKEQYDTLFQPQVLSIILNREVKQELQLTKQKTGQKNMRNLMKITLYKQYLQLIGYQGDLKKAPMVKKKSFS